MDSTARSFIGIEDDNNEVASDDRSVRADVIIAVTTMEETEEEADDVEDGIVTNKVYFIASLEL